MSFELLQDKKNLSELAGSEQDSGRYSRQSPVLHHSVGGIGLNNSDAVTGQPGLATLQAGHDCPL